MKTTISRAVACELQARQEGTQCPVSKPKDRTALIAVGVLAIIPTAIFVLSALHIINFSTY